MKQKIIRVIAVIFGVGLCYALIVLGLILSASREQAPDNVPVMIVLGAKVSSGNPAEPSKVLKERLDTAAMYLLENPDTIVVVTGGQGSNEGEPEGVVMGRYLETQGISAKRIFVESTSVDTIENINHALEIIDTDTVVMVTNDYHIYRSKLMAEKLGIETVYGQAAPSTTGMTLYSYFREILAVGYHLIFSH